MKRIVAGAALTMVLAVVVPTASEVPAASPPPGLARGDVIPEFRGQALDGTYTDVTFPEKSKTVLIFFLSGCNHCRQMFPQWNRATERKPAETKVLGVMLDEAPAGFFSAYPVSFPVVRAPSREFARKLKIATVPVTVRVGAGGRVDDVGQGQLDAIRVGELFRR